MRIKRDKLDDLFSEFVRKRAIAKVGGCEKCLAQKHDIVKDNGKILPAWKQLQCSHFEKRRKQATRFDEMNCNGFCFGCHQYFEENYEEYKVWLIAQIGEYEFDLLNGRARITYPKPDRELVRLYIEQKIEEVNNE